MPRVDRHKLHFGPYKTPAFRYGAKVDCEARGEVTITRLSDGRIQWPVGQTKRATLLVLYGDLAKAVRREAACAVCYWWGVGASTVNNWRRALGVTFTEGDRLLRAAYGRSPSGQKALKAMHTKAQDPERRAKIAAAKRGKARPAAVIEALRKANKGRKLSAEHRRKMSEDRRQRGVRPPWLNRAWSAAEDQLCRNLPPEEVTAKTGRTLTAVFLRRHKLGLADGRKKAERRKTGRSK